MSKKASPIPVQTSITDGKNLTIPWRKYLQEMGNDWVSENRVLTSTNKTFNYTINGCICFFSFIGTEITTITLPYPVLVDSVIEGTIYTKGTTEITLSSPISGFYFCNV